MSRLWYDVKGRQAAERLGRACPQSWSDYMRLAGNKVPGAEVVTLADLHALPEYGPDPIPDWLRWAIWERDDFTCQQCGTRRFLQIDHVYPKSRGGPTVAENLQTLCKRCNSRKFNLVL